MSVRCARRNILARSRGLRGRRFLLLLRLAGRRDYERQYQRTAQVCKSIRHKISFINSSTKLDTLEIQEWSSTFASDQITSALARVYRSDRTHARPLCQSTKGLIESRVY